MSTSKIVCGCGVAKKRGEDVRVGKERHGCWGDSRPWSQTLHTNQVITHSQLVTTVNSSLKFGLWRVDWHPRQRSDAEALMPKCLGLPEIRGGS